MEKWVFAVYTDCQSPNREKEFNDWYDKTHIPDILKIPGFIHATRYETDKPAEGQVKYFALYEIETEDINQTMALLQDTIAKLGEQGRLSDAVSVKSTAFYRQRTPI